MLYPKEDRNNSQLMFACRTCNFSEPAPSQCVWRNQLTNTVAETAGVTTDVGGDPTVSDSDISSLFCLMCGNFIMEHSSRKEEKSSIETSIVVKGVEMLNSLDADELA